MATDDLTAKLKALSDPTRRTLVEILQADHSSVTELAERFSMTRPAVSKHLGILRDAGLVSARRDGRQQIYRLEAGALEGVREWLEPFLKPASEAAQGPARRPRRPARRPRRQSGRDDWRSW